MDTEDSKEKKIENVEHGDNIKSDLEKKQKIIPISGEYDTLVLSGGAVNAISILGCLQYCMDNFILSKVHTYFGSSAGAMICYFLAIGYTPIEIIVNICTNQMLERVKYFDYLSMMRGEGAVSFTPFMDVLERMTIKKIGRLITLKELYKQFGKKLICTSYNETKDETEYIDCENYPDMPCLIAIKLSSNLPFVFEKFKYMGSYYIDGCLTDHFPILKADETGEKILGLNLWGNKNSFDPDKNILEYIYKLMYIPMEQNNKRQLTQASKKCDIITLKGHTLKFFEFDISTTDKLNLFSLGYQQGKKYFEKQNVED